MNHHDKPTALPAGFETQAIRTQIDRSLHGEHSVPVYLTSSYAFESAEEAEQKFAGTLDGPIYSRYTNPNTTELITKICAMEGAEDGLALSSGMASIWVALAGMLSAGDHVIVSKAVFGSTWNIAVNILPRFGISCSLVKLTDLADWQKAVRPETRALFVETPSNPGLEIADLAALSALSKQIGALLIVDNTFCSPYLQKPLQLGANIVCHSTTKYLDGQGRVMGGIVVSNGANIEKMRFFSRHTGPAMAPFNAWVVSKSLETLALRMDRHCSSAIMVAKALSDSKSLVQVRYPFLESHPQAALAHSQMTAGGGIVTFEVRNVDCARKLINQLRMITCSANLGDSRSIITHPATTTHARVPLELREELGISPGLLRLSVGLECVDDIIADLQQAIAAAMLVS